MNVSAAHRMRHLDDRAIQGGLTGRGRFTGTRKQTRRLSEKARLDYAFEARIEQSLDLFPGMDLHSCARLSAIAAKHQMGAPRSSEGLEACERLGPVVSDGEALANCQFN